MKWRWWASRQRCRREWEPLTPPPSLPPRTHTAACTHAGLTPTVFLKRSPHEGTLCFVFLCLDSLRLAPSWARGGCGEGGTGFGVG
jgi:hypothetical protein